MTSTSRQTFRPTLRGVPPLLWAIAALGLPAAALAQGSACDQLKATLAARIEATGVRGYSLEAVSAATPVPAGAKAIGNCEGGVRKILYRRFGGASATTPAEAVTGAASSPVVATEPPPKRLPPVVRPAPPATVASTAPVAAPASTPTPEPAQPLTARPGDVDLVRPIEPTTPPKVVLAETDAIIPGTPGLVHRVSGFVSQNWHWLLALLLVPLAAVGWAWRAHHLAYDKNGLPRGPRL